MKNPFEIVKDFEQAIAEYTGAPYVVCVNSCTNALFLAMWHYKIRVISRLIEGVNDYIEIPKRTYLSVPMQAKMIGFKLKFTDENWSGMYQLKPWPIYDAARRFTKNMAAMSNQEEMCYMCVSFHWNKILGIQQGGAILHNDSIFDKWARRARFDGRTEGVKPKDDNPILGWHMYMSPEIAAEGLVRLMHLPKYNKDLPWDDYPDLSQYEIFKSPTLIEMDLYK